MRVLVWQWGRRGAGPRFAASLADGLRLVGAGAVALSLSSRAEILRSGQAPVCDLVVDTYGSAVGLALRLVQAPWLMVRLMRQVRRLGVDLAICAMPGPMDLIFLAALHRLGVPVAVVVHDADAHPGDAVPLLMPLQRWLLQRADAVVALSSHVATQLRRQRLLAPDARLLVVPHPPFQFAPAPPPPCSHDGPLRLLSFGRLLPYKGLDLLADALHLLPDPARFDVRVVGSGPEGPALAALRALPNVSVENRWVPEDEVGALLAWSDALVLPYREASQSGVAPAALAAGRFVVATNVGGLVEQLGTAPRAILCDPTAEGVANGITRLLSMPPDSGAADDAVSAWQAMAGSLLDQLRPLLCSDPTISSIRRPSVVGLEPQPWPDFSPAPPS
jgi:glycosyltransferase involved in cell wall biosynthesis